MVMRPTCSSHGCSSPVTFSHTSAGGIKRWRHVCARCQRASYGNGTTAEGVILFATHVCSNEDGHLGFPCVCDPSLVPSGFHLATHVDHKDGNHTNNSYSNLEELCVNCHAWKSKINGDHDGSKNKK